MQIDIAEWANTYLQVDIVLGAAHPAAERPRVEVNVSRTSAPSVDARSIFVA